MMVYQTILTLLQYLHSLMALKRADVAANTNHKRLLDVQMALEALRNVLRNNPGTFLSY